MDLFAKLRRLKVLLVDDDEWIRHSMYLLFEAEGCHLLAVATGEQAMEELSQEDYDIIIIDYRLPRMDGLEVLKLIQQTHPRTMKIFTTAYRSEEVIAEAKRAGIDDFIEKPFTAGTIEASLCRLISSREHKEEPECTRDA